MRIHVDARNFAKLVNERTFLRVFAACDPSHVMDEGELIGYAESPTVVLRRADGSLKSWQTSLAMETIPAPKIGGLVVTPDEQREIDIDAVEDKLDGFLRKPGDELSSPHDLVTDLSASELLDALHRADLLRIPSRPYSSTSEEDAR